MKPTDMKWKEASPCSSKKNPVPQDIVCPDCKAETEVWSDEEDAVCGSCGVRVTLNNAGSAR